MQQQPEGSVSAGNAWRAAVERAKRGTEALIVVEAQVLELEQQLTEAGAEIERLKREVETAEQVTAETKRLMERRTATLRRRAEAAEGVSDGQGDQEQPAEAVGEAVPTHPFSD